LFLHFYKILFLDVFLVFILPPPPPSILLHIHTTKSCLAEQVNCVQGEFGLHLEESDSFF